MLACFIATVVAVEHWFVIVLLPRRGFLEKEVGG